MTKQILHLIPHPPKLGAALALFVLIAPGLVAALYWRGWLETMVDLVAVSLATVTISGTVVISLSTVVLFFVLKNKLNLQREKHQHQVALMSLDRRRLSVEIQSLQADNQVKLLAASNQNQLNQANITAILSRIEQQSAALLAFASGQAGRVAAGDIQIERPARPQLESTVQSDQVATERDLKEIFRFDNLLIVGSKDSGKTTLLQHLENAKLHAGHRCLILDSHSQPGKWAGAVTGSGRDYRLIQLAMVALVDLMHQRYVEYSAGRSQFPPVTIFIDEYTLLPEAVSKHGYDIGNFISPILTEGRKVAINLVVGVHSDRVKVLGVAGKGDLLESFDVKAKLKIVGDNRYALVDFGEGYLKEKFTYTPNLMPRMIDGPAVGAGLVPELGELSDFDHQVFEAWHCGHHNLVALRQELGMASSGQNNAKIRASLKSLGLELESN